MRAWWWLLITAHLVCGSPERYKDDNKNIINHETIQNSVAAPIVYPSFILDPNLLYIDTQRSPSEGDIREKKEMGFHSWGGKRYSDDEEDEKDEKGEDNNDIEDNRVFHEPDEEDLKNNEASLETDDLGDNYREAFPKRKKTSLAFSSWGGKRDPEVINNVGKRSNFDSSIFPKRLIESKFEMNRRKYPFFSSWAGKRATAFNSWGGKRDYSKEKKEFSEVKTGVMGDTENLVNLKDDHSQVHNSLNSQSLDSEDKVHFQRHDFDNNNHGNNFLKEIPEDKDIHFLNKRHFPPELLLENINEKRAAAFNSWGGKRIPEENLTIMKKPVSFNSWAGKRAAAFNSWGGKRAAAFNSWGGKRSEAFNSWGGKRAAAFNSWGGKRTAAFNSWGGKRNSDKLNDNPTIWLFPVTRSSDKNWETKTKKLIHQTGKLITRQELIFKNATNNNLDKTEEEKIRNIIKMLLNNKEFKNVNAEELNNHGITGYPKFVELFGHSTILEKRSRPSFTSWAGKRSPFFSSWYGNKTPTVLLTSGKRRPAFSSWGGKRSEHQTVRQLGSSAEKTGDKDTTFQQPEEVFSEELSPPEEKAYSRKKREVKNGDEKKSSVPAIKRVGRAIGVYKKNRVFTRRMQQKDWSHRKDFFAWGGKRFSNRGTLM